MGFMKIYEYRTVQENIYEILCNIKLVTAIYSNLKKKIKG